MCYISGIPNGDFNKLQVNNNANLSSKIETPNVKKRHRRAKSGGIKDSSQGDGKYMLYTIDDYLQPVLHSKDKIQT